LTDKSERDEKVEEDAAAEAAKGKEKKDKDGGNEMDNDISGKNDDEEMDPSSEDGRDLMASYAKGRKQNPPYQLLWSVNLPQKALLFQRITKSFPIY
jgi:nucleosome binding factor SPN SPT16 subunit